MTFSGLSRSSSSPSLLRLLSFSVSSVAVVLSLFPLLSSAQSSSSTCGGAGFDLSPLSVTSNPAVDLDLVYTDGSYWYGFHPCGIVKETFCPTPAAMMCEYGTTLAYNKPEDIVWTPYSADNNTQTGVTMTVANGQPCQLGSSEPAQPRSIDVHFVCDASVQSAKMITVTRVSACLTQAIVLTRYACAAAASTDSGSGLSSSQKQTIAIVVSVVSLLVLIALTVVCVVMCRRWRAGQAVWAKTNTGKLLDTATSDASDKGVELSLSRV